MPVHRVTSPGKGPHERRKSLCQARNARSESGGPLRALNRGMSRGLLRATGGIALALLLMQAVSPAVRAEEAVPGDGVDREARLARGILLFAQSDFSAGLALLRDTASEHPGWRTAAEALGTALLRSGLAEEARPIYEQLLGAATAERLTSGDLEAGDVPAGTDPDALLGLGMASELSGKTLEAERLFRIYADLVGPTEPAAARAYRRLAILFGNEDVPWGDPAAEEAKATAVDPRSESGQALPPFPDGSKDTSLEPYFRPVERSSERSDSLSFFDAPPWLTHWEPPDLASRSGGEVRDVAVEVLVDTAGAVLEAVPLETTLAETVASRVRQRVTRWRFAPATLNGRPTDAWALVTARVALPPATERATAPGDTTSTPGEQPTEPSPGNGDAEQTERSTEDRDNTTETSEDP